MLIRGFAAQGKINHHVIVWVERIGGRAPVVSEAAGLHVYEGMILWQGGVMLRPVNQTVRGYVFPAGDVDHYKFYVNSSGILQVQIEGVPGDMRTRIELEYF